MLKKETTYRVLILKVINCKQLKITRLNNNYDEHINSSY